MTAGQSIQIRPGLYRAGFRSIAHGSYPTLSDALGRLAADGHLDRRKCLIVRNARGRYTPLVYKGGRVRRIPQGTGVGARVTQALGPADPAHAWLEVPADCVHEAVEWMAAHA